MKKKVIFFMFSFSGGGAERTILNIINHIDKKKFDIHLVLGTTKNNDYLQFISDGIKVQVLDCVKLRFSIFKLRKYILKEKPDLLFSTINANNIVLLLARFLTFKKIKTIVREANHRTQSGKVSLWNKILTFLLYNFIATKVIALSNGVKNDLTSNFKINENKIQVIYNPVDVENIQKLSDEEISDLDTRASEKLVIAVGRLVDQKDFDTLIKAFKIVSKNVTSKLVILGKGPKENHLRGLCKNLDLDEKVLFLGFKENPYKYMKKADVFVLSSKWEGFGHVIVESMVAGTPVVSTDCKSGPAEILEDNKHGLLVPVSDSESMAEKILFLLNEDDVRKEFIEKGYRRAMEFNAKNIVQKYSDTFEYL